MAKWVIVKFLDSLDDEEAAFTFCVIPTSWLETDDGADYARWPPSTNSQKELKAIEKMIQDGTPACIEWPIHIVIEKTPEIVRTESPGEEVRSGDGESTNSHGMLQPPVGHGISSQGNDMEVL
ncbi:uncharacterized protein LOC124166821 [Ischnura elegans]|uniref:uncharacterized protein LOC124166821 n=1 Tax=Ischnura elegans TaxID=197161 RepID=UPI001ED8ACBF|nr:uncharacterized protein LOC124166821 [Ischnura elegans]